MTHRSSITLKVKRIYDAPAHSDGCRVLVDRIWPRGLSKDTGNLDAWFKDLAPSTELRKWFGHDPSKWTAFKRKYFQELDQKDSVAKQLLEPFSRHTVTLLFAAKDSAHNNAVALKEYVEKHLESTT
jgi:uncharacterized protein YeaO (DUF488 family)